MAAVINMFSSFYTKGNIFYCHRSDRLILRIITTQFKNIENANIDVLTTNNVKQTDRIKLNGGFGGGVILWHPHASTPQKQTQACARGKRTKVSSRRSAVTPYYFNT